MNFISAFILIATAVMAHRDTPYTDDEGYTCDIMAGNSAKIECNKCSSEANACFRYDFDI